jgi:DNA-binding SARP family transcriptional activator
VTAALEIRLFGGLRLTHLGQDLRPPTRRAVASLLAYLVLGHDRPLDRDQLAATLFGAHEDPRGALRLVLHHLRHWLPGPDAARPWLLQDGSRLRWNPQADAWVDVLDFDARSRAWLADEAAPAAEGAALAALVTGPLLAGMDEDWIPARRDHYAERHRRLLGRLAEAQAREGQPGLAVDTAEAAIAAQPLDEAGWRRLMRLQAAAGDRAAALATYARCRALLAEEVGQAPEPETQALAEALRTGVAELRPAKAPAMTGGPPPAAPAGLLLGDRATRLRQLLEAHRLVSLVGPPGAGKSALAATVAAQRDEPGSTRVAWLDGAAGDAPLPDDAPGWPNGPDGAPARLLVLDDAEGQLARWADWLARLLAGHEALRVLVTSREPLGLRGERVWRLPLLTLPEPPAGDGREARALASESVRLLLQAAGWDRAGPGPDAGTARPLATVARALDGLPMALVAAAGVLRSGLLEALVAGLDDCLDLLDRHGGRCAGRYATVSESLSASWDHSTDEEQDLLRRLLDQPAPFAAADVLASDAQLDVLERLVARSLVQSDPNAPAGGRLWLLGLVRQLVRRQA